MINSQDIAKKYFKTWSFIFFMLMGSLLLSNGFYLKGLEPLLTPNDRLSAAGAAVLLMICAFLWFAQKARMTEAICSRYGLMIIGFFICIHFSTFVIGGLVEHRQPIFHSGLVLTRIYAGLLVFFCLAVLCKTDKLFFVLHKFILIFGIIWLLFFCLAYISPDFCSQFYKTPGKNFQIRLDTVRFTPPAGVRVAIMYTCFYSLIRFMQATKFNNIYWLFIYIIGVFDFFFVCMLRRYCIALVLIPIFYILTFMNMTKKVLLSSGIVIAAIVMISFPALTERAFWIVESVIDQASSSRKTSVNIRTSAFEYYFPELKRSAYIGYGYYAPEMTSVDSRLAYGQGIGYYEGDLGIFMAFLMYGIQAIIWSAVMYYLILKNLIRAKFLHTQMNSIKNALLVTFLWPLLSLHTFTWGYHEAFWWGIMIFMAYYVTFVSTNSTPQQKK